MTEWMDLEPYMEDLIEASTSREVQKRGYRSTKQWAASSTHLLGLMGEKVYGLTIGLDPDLELRVWGDDGWDFPGTDVKASTYWRDPWLKVVDPDPSIVYVLVGLDMRRHRGYVAGIYSGPDVKAAPLRDWGNGPAHSLPAITKPTAQKFTCPPTFV